MKSYTLIVGDEKGLRGNEPYKESLTPTTLRARREALGISRNRLALEAACSAVYIAKLESGERKLEGSIHDRLSIALQRLENSQNPE